MSTLLLAEAAPSGRVPPLANGDWLKRDDFHRRYLATPGLKKAELVVWSVDEGRIDWWERIEGDYLTIPLDDDGLARSRIFPGLWLDAHALLRGDMRAVFAAVQRGLDVSP